MVFWLILAWVCDWCASADHQTNTLRSSNIVSIKDDSCEEHPKVKPARFNPPKASIPNDTITTVLVKDRLQHMNELLFSNTSEDMFHTPDFIYVGRAAIDSSVNFDKMLYMSSV